MKTSGPSSPQTIRGLRDRRSLRGLLDTRWHQEADLTTEPMVGPFGKGFHRLKTPQGTEYTVADASGQTWAPGAQVMVANPQGLGYRAVIGNPPAGKKGGASRTRSSRTRGQAAPNYYAFWGDGRAGLYIDGEFSSYRATGGPEISVPSLIHEDSEGIVGPGSITGLTDSTHIRVWDVEGEASYDYEADAGYLLTPPVYDEGYVWWIEREAVQHGGVGTHATNFRLMKSRTDLSTDLAVVYTYEAEHYTGFSAIWDDLVGVAITSAGVLTQCRWEDEAAAEVNGLLQVRIARGGGAAADNGWPAIAPPPAVEVDDWEFQVAPKTAAGLAAGFVATGFLAGQADDPETSPFAFWSGAEWELIECSNTCVSANGTEGGVFSGAAFVRGPATTGTPTIRFDVGPSPEDDIPSYFFIKG